MCHKLHIYQSESLSSKKSFSEHVCSLCLQEPLCSQYSLFCGCRLTHLPGWSILKPFMLISHQPNARKNSTRVYKPEHMSKGDFNKPAKTTSWVWCGKTTWQRRVSLSAGCFLFSIFLPVCEPLSHVVSTWFAYKQMLQAWICLQSYLLSCLISSYLSWTQRPAVCSLVCHSLNKLTLTHWSERVWLANHWVYGSRNDHRLTKDSQLTFKKTQNSCTVLQASLSVCFQFVCVSKSLLRR